ncbi:YceI family protein [Pontibacter sp. KCTC 32443]|uniref:YceI family protein n=1 Tax=Pontibacter TaxID=323449 RepID=UPI00164D028A|nr:MULTISPECIES: YceI family protein [Pontibacter]MBC5773071.1 YceI family protein [Pontibacter sp. KCTC 32443]
MKKPLLLLSAFAFSTLLSIAATAPGHTPGNSTSVAAVAATTLQVNTTQSTMKWNAKKVGGEHYGTIKLAAGSLEVKGNKLTGGTFTIDMATIVVEDITRPESNKKLTDHLKSDDFFSVDKHPSSIFKITKATPIAKAKPGEANYTITGNLTIKGITNAITFPATVAISGKEAQAEAVIEVDRTKYDIKYRSGLVGTAADKIIYDTFTINLKLVAGAEGQAVGSTK